MPSPVLINPKYRQRPFAPPKLPTSIAQATALSPPGPSPRPRGPPGPPAGPRRFGIGESDVAPIP